MSSELRHYKTWRRLGLLLVAADVYLSLAPVGAGPGLLPDKLGHFLMYALLGFWFATLYPRALGWVLAGGLALGGTLELVQGLGTMRHAEWPDMMANVAGCLTGCGLVVLLPFNAFRWLERKLQTAVQ